jgi:TPR repeat protein
MFAAAERGDPSAQWQIGRAYEFGVGVPRNENAAIAFYKQAAAKGVLDAQQALRRLKVPADDGCSLQ